MLAPAHTGAEEMVAGLDFIPVNVQYTCSAISGGLGAIEHADGRDQFEAGSVMEHNR